MMLPRMHDSPVPMNTMSGFDSATATAPTDDVVIWVSVTGFQERPPSMVFHNPPPTAPKYPSFGRPLTPETAMERPPRSGPMLRQRRPSRIALSSDGSAGLKACATELGVSGPESAEAAATRSPTRSASVSVERAFRPAASINERAAIQNEGRRNIPEV